MLIHEVAQHCKWWALPSIHRLGVIITSYWIIQRLSNSKVDNQHENAQDCSVLIKHCRDTLYRHRWLKVCFSMFDPKQHRADCTSTPTGSKALKQTSCTGWLHSKVTRQSLPSTQVLAWASNSKVVIPCGFRVLVIGQVSLVNGEVYFIWVC